MQHIFILYDYLSENFVRYSFVHFNDFIYFLYVYKFVYLQCETNPIERTTWITEFIEKHFETDNEGLFNLILCNI